MRQASILTITAALVLSGVATSPANALPDYDGSNGIVNCVDDGSVTGSGSFVIELNVVTSNTECTGRAVIPSGVTSIGMNAFRYSNLSSIVIPATVVSIDAEAMSGTYDLKTVSFESQSQLASIGPSAFRNSRITRILIPESVTSIGISSFEGTRRLVAVKFAGTSNLASIGDAAFRYSNLSSIVIPANVISIGNFAFQNTYRLAIVKFASMSQLASIGEAAFMESRLSSIVIPAGVTSIGDSAFLKTSNLVSFSVDPGNTSFVEVDNVLFTADEKTLVAYPTGFTSAIYTIPESVTSIGSGAFAGSLMLESLNVAEGNIDFVAVDNVLFRADGATLLAYPTGRNEATYTIPANVTTISDYAFYGGYYLTSILFASSSRLAAIGNSAFTYTSPTSMAFPASLTTVGDSAFFGSYALQSVTFASPSQLTSIGSGAFQYSGITSIVIPAGVTSVGASSFDGAQSLSAVTFASPSQLTSIGSGAFQYSGITSIVIPAGVTSVGASSFDGARSLSAVTFASPSQLTSIGSGAFQYSGITSIVIPAGVTSVEASSFEGAKSLSAVTFASPSQLTSIGTYAFSNTPLLVSVNIPVGVTLIGSGAFQGSGITSINIPASVTSIGEVAFGNTQITSITIPASVTSIAPGAFLDAMRLTTIIFLGSIDAGSQENGTISLPDLTREGHTFGGWYSDANLTTKVGDAYSLFSVIQPTSLFAKLTKKAEATTKPSITGTAVVSTTKTANKITANKGVWTGTPVPTISFQWYSCTAQVGSATATIPSTCKTIAGAIRPTLVITNTFKGKYLAVAVTGQSAGTTATTWLSKTTAKVK